MTSDDLRADIEAIKERNARVEADKAWETSRFRVCAVAVLTYLTMVLLMHAIGGTAPFLSALVPTTGFLLSTLTMRVAKKLWLARFYQGSR